MDPIEFGQFDLDIINGGINGGATALQWGDDGLLYAVGRNGFVYAIEVTKQTDAQGETTGYTGEIKWEHDLGTPNFNDEGELVGGGSRQALGLAVTTDEDTGETVVYVSHSDIKIGAGGGGGSGDVNLDTNSGVITRIKLDTSDPENIVENEAIDLIRGLPRSEENHATNGLALTTNDDGDPILLIAQGGHANAGAPSVNFVGLPEYTYSGAVLSADLNKLAAIEAAKKGVDSDIDHVLDLPTLDDPTRPNFVDSNGNDVWIDANFDGELDTVVEYVDQDGDGIADWMVDQDGDGDVDADDMADFVATKIVDADGDSVADTILYQEGGSADDNVTGVRGGNDGLNQAKLLEGNPLQVYSSGYRNTYDVLVTEDGRKYTYDNGANGGWGGVAVTNPDGTVTNEPNNVNETQNFDQLHEFDEGFHGGHPNPTVASGADAGLWTSPTTGPNSSTTLPIADWRQLSDTPLPNIGQEDDGLVLPADWDEVVDPALINPDAGVYNEGGSFADGALDADKGSWNGLAEYTGTAFGGQLEGAILVTKTGGDVKWIQRDQFGDISVVAKNGGSLNPDTIVEAVVEDGTTNFIFDPRPAPDDEALLVAGVPAWRTVLRLEVPQVLNGPPELCALVTCPFTLDPEEINTASLVLTSREAAPGFGPRDTVRLDIRPVLAPERLPKSPLGATLLNSLGQHTRVRAEAFRAGGRTEAELPLTSFVRDQLRGTTDGGGDPPTTVTVLSIQEPLSFDLGWFDGPDGATPPFIRILLTVADSLEVR